MHGIGTAAKFVVLFLATVVTLGPVVWGLITALTPTDPVTHTTSVGGSAFADVFAKIPVWLYVWNSALVTLLVAVGQMLSAAMAGYVFARFEFRSKKVLFGLILATMMVPMQVTIVPVFMLIRGMGLADTLLALILPALPTAFGTFLMRQFFMGLPAELGEAAEIDGAGPWRVFFSVYPPLATPGMAIVGILAFNYHWNEFFRAAHHDDQRPELHPSPRARDPAGQPGNRQRFDGARGRHHLDDPSPGRLHLRAGAAARGPRQRGRRGADFRSQHREEDHGPLALPATAQLDQRPQRARLS